MVPLGTGRLLVSLAQGFRSLQRVTYQACGSAWPNVVSGPSGTRRVPTDTGKTRRSALMRGHTRRGWAERSRVKPSSGCDAAAHAATRACVVASATARPLPPLRTERQWRWPATAVGLAVGRPTAVPTAALTIVYFGRFYHRHPIEASMRPSTHRNASRWEHSRFPSNPSIRCDCS